MSTRPTEGIGLIYLFAALWTEHMDPLAHISHLAVLELHREWTTPQGDGFFRSSRVRCTDLTSPRRPRGFRTSPLRVRMMPWAFPIVTSNDSLAFRVSMSSGFNTRCKAVL